MDQAFWKLVIQLDIRCPAFLETGYSATTGYLDPAFLKPNIRVSGFKICIQNNYNNYHIDERLSWVFITMTYYGAHL